MDRVSYLPDEIRCHVLSFLTTKEAALTSVLSKKWRNLIAFVPCLDIDNTVFLRPEEGKEDRQEIVEGFMDFVDRILALQVLYSLVKLEIDYGPHLSCVHLPVLKTLILEKIELNKFDVFLRALPALEELVLVDIHWRDLNVIVSSASLKRLIIYIDESLDSLSLDTPSLVYLKYCGSIALDYPVVSLTSLLNAQISFSFDDEIIERARGPSNDWSVDNEDEVALWFSNAWKLFHAIRNVPNRLHLSSDALEVLSRCCENMPVFNNLKLLSIKSDKDRGWQAMPVLLRNCPHLETLVIDGLVHFVTEKCGDACDCIIREDKGLSLASCPVKMLAIQGFRGTMKEMNMIRHFLDKFPCLKEMKIMIEHEEPTQLANPEIEKLVVEMFEYYNQLYSCNVQLLEWSA